MSANKEQSSTPTLKERLKLREDYRARLPLFVSRFLGYRPPDATAPYDPLPFPPFSWLRHIPMPVEVGIFTWCGSFGGILLIEAIMSTNTAFHDVYGAPLIVTSFGASAVLLFCAIESPLAQPRNFVLGHFVSALVGTAITRLFVRNPFYHPFADGDDFHANVFVNGGISMATAAVAQFLIGAVHPPSGATALNAAVQSDIITLSWRYLPTVLASSLIMLGWALIINNLGRRRYPIYWWSAGKTFVSASKMAQRKEHVRQLSEVEAGLRGTEGDVFDAPRAEGDVSSTPNGG